MVRFRLSRRDRGEGSDGEAPPAGGFQKPVAREVSLGKAAGCGVAFFAVFLLAGLGFSAFFVWPLVRLVEARSWVETPCEVIESRVATHAGDDGDTYSVEAVYRYTVAGREYRSERYDFFPGSTSGYEGKARIVESLPPGTRTVCWVDPEDPAEAVLTRRITTEYLFGLIPLAFVAVGLGGIVLVLVGVRKKRARVAGGRPEWLPEQDAESDSETHEAFEAGRPVAMTAGASEPIVLEARHSPLGKLLGITFIALFWNGIVSVFVYHAWQGWRTGSPDGCLTLFLVPFVAVGVLLLVGVPYQFLALFNPRPRLTLTPGRLALGGEAELAWSFSGWPGRIRRLEVSLEGVEEADYTRGTDRHTDRETFATYRLLESTRPVEIAQGYARVAIPADTMHTFEAPDNRIVWTLKVQGEIRLWPDVLEEFRVVIHPLPLEGVR